LGISLFLLLLLLLFLLLLQNEKQHPLLSQSKSKRTSKSLRASMSCLWSLARPVSSA